MNPVYNHGTWIVIKGYSTQKDGKGGWTKRRSDTLTVSTKYYKTHFSSPSGCNSFPLSLNLLTSNHRPSPNESCLSTEPYRRVTRARTTSTVMGTLLHLLDRYISCDRKETLGVFCLDPLDYFLNRDDVAQKLYPCLSIEHTNKFLLSITSSTWPLIFFGSFNLLRELLCLFNSK